MSLSVNIQAGKGWSSVDYSGVTHITPPNGEALLIGPDEGLSELYSAGTTAYFTDSAGQGINYFMNSSIGSGFVPLGSLFVGMRAQGSYGAETAVQAGDYLGALAFGAYDGNEYSFNASGAHTFPGFWATAESTAAGNTFESSFHIGGFTSPIVEIVAKNSGGDKIGFFGATPVVQPSAYTVTNDSVDRSYDANSTSLDELADVLGTLISDLQGLGLVA